ncbi:Fe(3+)-hydroxamate ABC transporter permease FhuB [Cohnella panacarvi]|uniref:Fe(3+)-hydroxamate ABC transporter permease FhuB n=1 Tax=Cohnella panacarvi TaxID=400776 RepID=UPI00047E6482|nr:Fe(3+)-hydroxamate ABC transporter permease FhuB [Cohnella panacarvi]
MKAMKNQGVSPVSSRTVPARSAARGTGWKPFAMLLGGAALLAILAFISLTQGLRHISAATVIEAIVSPRDIAEHQIIHGVRLPRTVMGLLSGAALAVAGALMQSVTRNPLASETTLGVNAGAYLIVVLGTIFWPGLLHQYAFPMAVLGGGLAALAVFALGGGRRSTPIRIALSGMIVALVLSSITSALQLLYEESTQGLFIWGSGSLSQNDWSGARFAWPWIAGGITAVLLSVRHLDLLAFGEETSRSLGQNVSRTRVFAMAVAIVLACVSVSIVGPIGFIGLIAPHVVKLSGMTRHAWLLPVSALWGAAILVGADTIARTFASSAIGELPAGAVTALIGAPWIIWLALRASKRLNASPGSSAGSTMQVGQLGRRMPYAWLVFLFAGMLLIVCVGALMYGNTRLSASEVIAALTGNGTSANEKIIHLRLPRMLTALMAGIALAASGSLMQSSLRNPLADPHIVGVSGGAGVGAISLMLLFPQLSADWIPLGAFAGGLLAAGIVYASGWKRGLSPTVLTLVGIAVAAATAAMINMLVIHAKLTLAPALAWLSGSTYARSWTDFYQILPFVIVLAPLGWWLGRRVDLLSFNDESSLGLGLPVRHTRLVVALIAVLLASVAASVVGAVGFIGLLAPHAARMLAGPNHRRSVLLAILLGATLLVSADWLGRMILAPKEIPSGIVVALLGAPYLILLMVRSARAAQ